MKKTTYILIFALILSLLANALIVFLLIGRMEHRIPLYDVETETEEIHPEYSDSLDICQTENPDSPLSLESLVINDIEEDAYINIIIDSKYLDSDSVDIAHLLSEPVYVDSLLLTSPSNKIRIVVSSK